MSKSLKYQVVKLAKEKPQFRGFLLPLVDGKTATEESLRLSLTKLAHQNSELRADLVPMIKEAGILEKLKGMFFNNKETGNKVKFDSLPQDQKSEILEKEKKDEKKEDKSESKSESKPEKPEGVADRERPNIKNPSEMSDEDLSTALKSLKDDRGDLNGQLINALNPRTGWPGSEQQIQDHFRPQIDELDKMLKVLNDEQGNRDQAKAEKAKAEQEKAEQEKAKKIEEAKKKKEEAEKKEQERRDGLSDEERKKEDEENKKKLKEQEEEARAWMDYFEYGYSRSASLKYQLVRLAHSKPELRKHILPLLK